MEALASGIKGKRPILEWGDGGGRNKRAVAGMPNEKISNVRMTWDNKSRASKGGRLGTPNLSPRIKQKQKVGASGGNDWQP